MSIWARPERGRHDSLLLAQSLDERIPDDCGVRLLDEMLGKVDWSDWEAKYEQDGRGRPPLHPRYLAGCIIYGAMKRVASLRELEEATRMRQDFMWLMDGQTADHSTFCKFRARFDDDIGGLFKQLNRRVARERKLTLEEALIDGTRLRADSDRHGARTAKVLETQLEALEAQVAEHIRAMPEETEVSTDSPAAIEERLREYERRAGELDRRRRKLERALEIARERDEAKCAKDGRKAVPVRVPVTDPESHILPNKEGGYAPNYTPVLAVESEHGLIAGVCLAEGNGEADTVAPLMEQVSEIAPGSVKRILSDSAFGTGPNLKNMDEDGIEVYSPAGAAQRGDNPAARRIRPSPSPRRTGTRCRCTARSLTARHSCTTPTMIATTAPWDAGWTHRASLRGSLPTRRNPARNTAVWTAPTARLPGAASSTASPAAPSGAMPSSRTARRRPTACAPSRGRRSTPAGHP